MTNNEWARIRTFLDSRPGALTGRNRNREATLSPKLLAEIPKASSYIVCHEAPEKKSRKAIDTELAMAA
jgi:hypothetical protein